MSSRRAEAMAFLALLLAAVSLLITLRSALPVATAAPPAQEPPPETAQPDPISGAATAAAVEPTFNYQGTLRLADGSLATGTFTMTLSIYDIVIGGTPLHQETVPNVVVRDGLFTVLLGDNDANPIGPAVFADAPRFLGLAVVPDPEMEPRQRIHPVPWALQANTLVAGATVAGGMTVSGADLNVSGVDLNVSGGGLNVISGGLNVTGSTLTIANTGDQATLLTLASERSWAFRQHGTDAGTALKLQSIGGGGNKNFIIETTGNVGIGTTTPAGKLDVAGEFRVNGVTPVRILRYENTGNDADFDTGVAAADYYCVAAGWSTNYDLDESGAGDSLVWTHVTGGTWWARVSMRSHNNAENPDVDIVCFRQEIATWEGASTALNDPD